MHCFTLAMNENSREAFQATSLYLGEYDVLHTIESFKLQENCYCNGFDATGGSFQTLDSYTVEIFSSAIEHRKSCNWWVENEK